MDSPPAEQRGRGLSHAAHRVADGALLPVCHVRGDSGLPVGAPRAMADAGRALLPCGRGVQGNDRGRADRHPVVRPRVPLWIVRRSSSDALALLCRLVRELACNRRTARDERAVCERLVRDGARVSARLLSESAGHAAAILPARRLATRARSVLRLAGSRRTR